MIAEPVYGKLVGIPPTKVEAVIANEALVALVAIEADVANEADVALVAVPVKLPVNDPLNDPDADRLPVVDE